MIPSSRCLTLSWSMGTLLTSFNYSFFLALLFSFCLSTLQECEFFSGLPHVLLPTPFCFPNPYLLHACPSRWPSVVHVLASSHSHRPSVDGLLTHNHCPCAFLSPLAYPLAPHPRRRMLSCLPPCCLRVSTKTKQLQCGKHWLHHSLKKKNNIFSCCIAVQHGLKTLTKSIAFIGETG